MTWRKPPRHPHRFMSIKLHNYLRTYRKRVGFSQADVAFLLGCARGSKVSRYERCARQPSLRCALAYSVVLGVPLPELFAGVHAQVEQKIVNRAGALTNRLVAAKTDGVTAQKLAALKAITDPQD
jgi:transcriptional regulator with XRE-family HTH domain